jgi:hypothetical protein
MIENQTDTAEPMLPNQGWGYCGDRRVGSNEAEAGDETSGFGFGSVT